MILSKFSKAIVYSCLTIVVGILSHKVIKMYAKRRRLPPSKFPWPLIGNITSLDMSKFAHERMDDMAAKLGPVLTVFLGHNPCVFVIDAHLANEVLKKQTFAGRPTSDVSDILFKDGSVDIISADYGREWQALRKVGHTAARNYASSPQFIETVSRVVDRIIDRVKDQEDFDSEDTLSLLMIGILAEAAFGKKYDFDDEEFIQWKKVVTTQSNFGPLLLMIFIFPFLRHIFRGTWKHMMDNLRYQQSYVARMYEKSLENHAKGKNESFCDAIISAKQEAEQEDHWMLPFLNQNNLHNAVFDLFAAGSETTKMTLRWVFLLMCKHEAMQERMRNEVDQVIGQEIPDIRHKNDCHFTNAFISETMRFRPTVPTTVAHKALVDEEIGGHPIPKDTMVIISLYNALHDETVWRDAQEFQPERFLDSGGNFVSMPNNNYIPFSAGRRSCPGNKLALNNMFLIVCRFLQRTVSIGVTGGITEEHMKGDLKKNSGWMVVPFSLRMKLRGKDVVTIK